MWKISRSIDSRRKPIGGICPYLLLAVVMEAAWATIDLRLALGVSYANPVE
jgi:hypothetical protein